MTRQDLLEEIRKISNERFLSVEKIQYNEFLDQPEYEYLRLEFRKYRLKNEKWHQIVRFALSDKQEHRYMYDRLLQLLLRHRKGYSDYFQLKTEKGTVLFPDRISEINMLFSIYKDYFRIFSSIIEHVHFDYPIKKTVENQIQGKIDWDDTVKNNYIAYPLKFHLIKWYKEFLVPENILLVLSSFWLHKTAKNLLGISFVEPLTTTELNTLNYIMRRTHNILSFFPFQEVRAYATKYFSLAYNDNRILELERMTELRIGQGVVRSYKYLQLLQWIKKFRQMNIRMLSANRTNFPLETLENLDTIYEAWIFFEFVEFFSKMEKLSNLQVDKNPNYFEVKYNERRFRFISQERFVRGFKYAWAVDSFPDFTVMEDDKILAVFDAKNYGATSDSKGDATHKILAYITNLDCGLGGLFFPNFETEEFSYPRPNVVAKHHFDLHVGHYRMQPLMSDDAIRSKDESMAKIFQEIIGRLITSRFLKR